MIRPLAVIVFLSTLFLALPALAQKASTVAGNVYYATDSNPARNVIVTLYNNQHEFIAQQATIDNGQFRFGGLRRDVYEVSVNVDGYEPFSITIDVSMASDRGLAIYLKPLNAKKNASQAQAPTVSVHELSMPAKARELMASGKQKLYQQRNAQASLADFQQALTVAPAYYEAAFQLAVAYFTLNDHARAETFFRNAFDLSGHTFAEASIQLGGLLLDRGDVRDAETSIRAGLQLNPNAWLGHYELGRLLLNEQHLPEALESAEQARLLAPSVPVVYRLLSNIHLLQKNYPALLEDLDTYLALDPNSAAGQRAKQLRDQIQQQYPSAPQRVAPASVHP
jgi:tetratricopeptide (TPR) repeat protein